MPGQPLERRQVRVRGTVQGVGFRPFVYRRARELGLAGTVGNDGHGVVLEVEGAAAAVSALLESLRASPPPLAVVESIEVSTLVATGQRGFTIGASASGAGSDARVSADVAPCAACLAELDDPEDRRYGYPFTNCTDCGPRYTIVRAVPYDRVSTTMSDFTMCRLCQQEYDDPGDRRFHAQPNACPDCGPRLTWFGPAPGYGPLGAAVACLLSGGVVAVKGVGGYHLACDATSSAAVLALRSRKSRPHKPFAVMVADLAGAEQLCALTAPAREALASAQRPVVLASRRRGAAVVEAVAPGLPELGLMLPSSPLHALLLTAVARPLVMTSGNRAAEPVVIDDTEAQRLLGPLTQGLLGHDRRIHLPVDDSVVRSAPDGRLQVLRRARGWVPQPLALPVPAAAAVLAVGAQDKSTVALAHGGSMVISQHLGDLGDWTAYRGFVAAVEHLVGLSGTAPAVVAHDLHPDLRSTAWAQLSGLPTLAVQHHHAHVASCLVEQGRTDPVLGIAYDGTGLGTDGTIWGGELLVADLTGAERVGHLRTVPLPGGQAAVREPWRMAVAWVHRTLGEDAAQEHGQRLDPRWAAVLSLARSGACLETSSVGRLFDAVAALLGIRTAVSYEGQAAVELEAVAVGVDCAPVYQFDLSSDTHTDVLDPTPMLAALLHDRARGIEVPVLAAGFHRGLADGTARLAERLASAHGLDTVALTGGVFTNVLLTDLCAGQLRASGLRVLLHERVPPGDGGISVGQAAVAAATWRVPAPT